MRTVAGPPCRTDVPASPYRLLWLELAERQYLDLPDNTRALVDETLTRLELDPANLTDAAYDTASDQWSALIADQGLMPYAVVAGCVAASGSCRAAGRGRVREQPDESKHDAQDDHLTQRRLSQLGRGPWHRRP
jgi:hypothetical protein